MKKATSTRVQKIIQVALKEEKNHSHNNRLQTEDKTRQNLREM